MSRNVFVAVTVAQSRTNFYFLQRLQQQQKLRDMFISGHVALGKLCRNKIARQVARKIAQYNSAFIIIDIILRAIRNTIAWTRLIKPQNNLHLPWIYTSQTVNTLHSTKLFSHKLLLTKVHCNLVDGFYSFLKVVSAGINSVTQD